MHKTRWVILVGVIAALLTGGLHVGRAQQDTRPLVLVVEGRRPLDTVAMTNIGTVGISQLADQFRQLGARVQFVRLNAPLPPEARVVVVARPLRSLRLLETVYLWQHVARGGSLLLALDPEEYPLAGRNVRPRYNRSGLALLIAQDFGLTVGDAFLAESWYSSSSIQKLENTYGLAFAELNGEPVTAPLAQYGVPVWVWGARSLTVDPLGPGSAAFPLLAMRAAYAETDSGVFRTQAFPNPPVPLRYDADKDPPAGLFTIGARAFSTASGARIAILGDSELLQNGYGLARDGALPRYPGNAIFAGRLSGWLLGLPETQWPGLPAGFTWVVPDGDPADWEGRALSPVADDQDAVQGAYDLAEAASFADDRYLYLLVRTYSAPGEPVWLEVTRSDGATVRVAADGATLTSPDGMQTSVPDAVLGIGGVLEARIPLRVAGTGRALTTVCLGQPGRAQPLDCLGSPLIVPSVQTRAPFDTLWNKHMLVTIHSTAGVYLRQGPSTSTAIQATLRSGTTLAALARTADGAWIQVQDARYAGWVAAYLLTPSGDFSTLPVMSTSSG
ncbi:MAG: SH3 domain-containing protein [Aggregatilineaceae bacterium]